MHENIYVILFFAAIELTFWPLKVTQNKVLAYGGCALMAPLLPLTLVLAMILALVLSSLAGMKK